MEREGGERERKRGLSLEQQRAAACIHPNTRVHTHKSYCIHTNTYANARIHGHAQTSARALVCARFVLVLPQQQRATVCRRGAALGRGRWQRKAQAALALAFACAFARVFALRFSSAGAAIQNDTSAWQGPGRTGPCRAGFGRRGITPAPEMGE